LSFLGAIQPIAAQWDSKHAIQDHLPRAAESIVENTAAASAAYSALKHVAMDYALGSSLESAACLDIAEAKHLIDAGGTLRLKHQLVEVFKMLVGLKRSWAGREIKDRVQIYGEGRQPSDKGVLFHHERLDVYQVGMTLIRSFSTATETQKLPIRLFRKLDGLATACVLNIAEGNRRFSTRDHCRFLKIAHQSAIKMATQLDICQLKKLVGDQSIHEWKHLLSRLASMTSVMIG